MRYFNEKILKLPRAIVRKLIIFTLFVALTFVVGQGNKNDKAFLLKDSLEQSFVKRNNFEKVILRWHRLNMHISIINHIHNM